ncbi:MAG TPA: GTPase [Candidatus Nanoarchaeia archaeon]|nr:GTPase [Candidatus Nanoarchaeia archaeon]
MVKNYWRLINKVIEQADILLLLLDARFMEETQNAEVEVKVKESKKPLIYVITKCDLVDKKLMDRIKLKPSVFVSATEHLGTTLLRERILIEGQRSYKDKETFAVGVLGYPNVGKSSLINALKGRKSAPTSAISGFTKGIQKVRADNRIIFLDTPGVIPYKEIDDHKHALIGTLEFNKIKDPGLIAMEFMKKYPGRIESYYGLALSADFEETLEALAKKKNLIKKHAELDLDRAAKMILKDWQTGKIT